MAWVQFGIIEACNLLQIYIFKACHIRCFEALNSMLTNSFMELVLHWMKCNFKPRIVGLIQCQSVRNMRETLSTEKGYILLFRSLWLIFAHDLCSQSDYLSQAMQSAITFFFTFGQVCCSVSFCVPGSLVIIIIWIAFCHKGIGPTSRNGKKGKNRNPQSCIFYNDWLHVHKKKTLTLNLLQQL